VLLKLSLQHSQPLLQDGHCAAFQPMRDELRAVEMQQADVKSASVGKQRASFGEDFVALCSLALLPSALSFFSLWRATRASKKFPNNSLPESPCSRAAAVTSARPPC
jgi:hypothetical protein